ncbi:MAG: GNAT family N-acetyltransferase [Methylocystis sp.]|nr:GNAT family N-acetyltransferase [Methylocystis sp.]MBI3274473.1 GNAT family N-acetyltransferase [Methylocystis sp.]
MALFRIGGYGERAIPIRGEGVYLRGADMRDFPAWVDLRERSRAFLTPWEPTWPLDDLTRASFRYRVRRHAEEMSRDEAYSFLVFREGDDALLGGLTLGHVRRGVSQSATLGYWMGEPFAGKGYMSRAVRGALEYAFATQRLHRIEAACLPTNVASLRLLERNGFKREGYARAYLNINGQWRDHLLFALLDSDPRPLRPPSPG